jgi:hypothetical protein
MQFIINCDGQAKAQRLPIFKNDLDESENRTRKPFDRITGCLLVDVAANQARGRF